MLGLDCIIVQECYDSEGKGQPEIIEKARKCEAYGAEVLHFQSSPINAAINSNKVLFG